MKKRYLYMDILNILSMISVVAMHVNGIVHTYSTARCWRTSLVIDGICNFAVPVLLMLSGANLLNYRKKYDTKTFFKKRFNRVLIPTIIWLAIMSIWKICIIKVIDVKGIGISGFIDLLFNNKIEVTYYYLFAILGVYLTMPILSTIVNEKNKKILWYLVFTYLIFNTLIPNILVLFNINWNGDFRLMIGGYVVYAVLGYLLSIEKISKKKRILIYVLGMLAIIYRYVTTYIWSTEANTIVKTTWGYFQFIAYAQAAAVFLFIKNLNLKKLEKNEKLTKIIAKIASCSFGVYLLHLIVKYYEVTIFNLNIRSWQFRTIGVITTYLISLTIVLIIKKIPILKRIVG